MSFEWRNQESKATRKAADLRTTRDQTYDNHLSRNRHIFQQVKHTTQSPFGFVKRRRRRSTRSQRNELRWFLVRLEDFAHASLSLLGKQEYYVLIVGARCIRGAVAHKLSCNNLDISWIEAADAVQH
jgi:hypothetical protein